MTAELLKNFVDDWWMSLAFPVGIVALVLGFYAPASCAQACSSCPWDRDQRRRRRYWSWCARRAKLWVLWDLVVATGCAVRVVADLVLGEATWTLPFIALLGAFGAREWLKDVKVVERARAELAKLDAT